MTSNGTVEEQPSMMCETAELPLPGLAMDTIELGESQTAAHLSNFEKALDYLEANEAEYRAEVEALAQQIRDYNEDLNRRAEALHLAQERLANRAADLDQYAKDLFSEVGSYNGTVRSGETKLLKLLNDLKLAERRNQDEAEM